MNAKPILFSTPMVQAILAGRKTQTRRVIKPQFPPGVFDGKYRYDGNDDAQYGIHGIELLDANGEPTEHYYDIKKPPYLPRDVLWVRETWTENCGMLQNALSGKKINYCADCKSDTTGLFAPCKWKKKSSIFMPRAAARIFLRVTDVRAERLQEISEADAKAEGCLNTFGFISSPENEYDQPPTTAKNAYIELWDSLNAKRGFGWDSNPWCWVYTFERTVAV